MIKTSTSPQLICYTTLRNFKIQNYTSELNPTIAVNLFHQNVDAKNITVIAYLLFVQYEVLTSQQHSEYVV